MNADNTRIEDQTINRFEQLINQMNAGFNRLENTLKSDINRDDFSLGRVLKARLTGFCIGFFLRHSSIVYHAPIAYEKLHQSQV